MDESDLLPLSALQHYRFCPRQCALIHLEQAWAENRLTAQGRVLHENTDKPAGRSAGAEGGRIVTAMPLRSLRLGLYGVADTVEFSSDGAPFPIEYKRGKPKPDTRDAVQLCAQALCLEEMTGRAVHAGALFYGETRHRLAVTFTLELRAETERLAASLRGMIDAGITPPAIYETAKCEACSLIELCRPKLPVRAVKLDIDWLARLHATESEH